MRRLSCFAVIALIALTSLGCDEEVTGSAPTIGDSETLLATDPAFMCNEDAGSWVTLFGSDFSPLVIDTIAREEDPDVELPTVTLILTASPTGASPQSEFSITLESPLGSDEGSIRWIDEGTMQFRVSSELELPAGVYDLLVENPNGESTRESEAFGVIPRPTLTAAIPEMTCVAQGERLVQLEGDDFLILGEQVPTVTVDGQEFEVIDVDNCRDLHAVFGDHQLCQEATVVLDEASLEAGVYPVSIQNFDPAGCANRPDEDGVTVTIVDPPTVSSIAPTPICGEQLAYESMEVEGEGFVILVGEEGTIYPEVHIGDQSFIATAASGCEIVEDAPVLGAERCTQLTISVGAGDLAGSLGEADLSAHPDVVVENPEPIGCHSTDDVTLTVVPAPMVASVTPDPICTAQFDNMLTVAGRGFLTIGAEEPHVLVDGGVYEIDNIDNCTAIANDGPETFSCETITFSIPAGELTDPDRLSVEIVNPATAACTSTEDATLRIVAPPMVSAITPQPLCIDQETRGLEIDGEGFLQIDGLLPVVTIGGLDFEANGVDDCEQLELDDDGREVHRCNRLFVDVTAGSLDDDHHDIIVTNPETAACSSEEELSLRTLPAPEITSVDPRAVCNNDGTASFDVTGEYLFEVDGVAPQIEIDGQVYATTTSGCTDFEDGDVQICTTLHVDIDPGLLAISDIASLIAINPDPIGCQSASAEGFYVAGPPAVVNAFPDALCDDDPFNGNVTLYGEFVFETGGDYPSVTVNNQGVSVDSVSRCDAIEVGDSSFESCIDLHISGLEVFEEDILDIVVTGASPLACGSDTYQIVRATSPVITSVVPERICSDGGTLSIQGSNLEAGAQFFLDGIAASTSTVSPDGTSATATFAGPLTQDFMTFSAVNPSACGDDYETQIRVYDGPQPVYVDPPVVYGEMNTQVTIYAAGLFGGSIDSVELLHPDGTVTDLDYESDPDRPNIVQAIIPAGLLDAGINSAEFGIRLTDDESCDNEGHGLLTITNELTVAIEDIDPPFGAQDQSTGVVITATDPLDPASGLVQFQAIPRAYLNPSDTGTGTLGREIRALQFIDETEIGGVVPSGLPVGTYDVIVVNPDGSVGVLEEAFDITEERPPLIDTVLPGAWDNGDAALQVTIEGQNFRADPTVEVFCRESGSTETDEALLLQPTSIVVDAVADEQVNLTVNATNLPRLSVCYMRLTNTDGTYAEYSPITVVNPAGKFMEFHPTLAFDTARRGLTSFSGVPSRTARYLYVIGGDDGASENAFTSGEYASLNRFGEPREWNYLPYDLPSGRTLSKGVRIHDFLYLVGGSDEGVITDEVLRAQVLDPLDVPQIINIDLELDEEDLYYDVPPDAVEGLDSGVYYYRVSAVYASTDPANPDGESLASEPQPINVPIDDVAVTISWEPPPYINHQILEFRIYRSLEPNDPYGNESLLATVDGSIFTYTDDGSDQPVAGINPLRLGSLGMWHHVATLEHPRQVAGVTVAANPDDPDQHFIYVVGGEDDDGARADYEFITVDDFGPRAQSVTPFATIGQFGGDDMLLPSPRTELTAVAAHEGNASVLTGVASQIFVVGGRSNTTADTEVKVATVTSDGHLEPWTSLGATRRISGGTRAGHACAVMNNNLVYLGGAGGNPSDDGYHVDIICDVNGSCPPATIGTNYSNLSALNMIPRVWMGSVTFRGFIYLTGGLTTGDVPTNTVDYSVAGGAP